MTTVNDIANAVPGLDVSDCIEHSATDMVCTGEVDYRYPLSGTGKSFPRCDFHWDKALDRHAEITRRYGSPGSPAPSDFDPTYAGESWDED